MLNVRSVSAQYGRARVLDGVSFDVEAAEIRGRMSRDHWARSRHDLVAGRFAIEGRGHATNASELHRERRYARPLFEQEKRVSPNDAARRNLHYPIGWRST